MSLFLRHPPVVFLQMLDSFWLCTATPPPALLLYCMGIFLHTLAFAGGGFDNLLNTLLKLVFTCFDADVRIFRERWSGRDVGRWVGGQRPNGLEGHCFARVGQSVIFFTF